MIIFQIKSLIENVLPLFGININFIKDITEKIDSFKRTLLCVLDKFLARKKITSNISQHYTMVDIYFRF